MSTGFKLKVRLPNGRLKLCGCGTRDADRYNAMRVWVQSLKRGKRPRLDVLEAIVLKGVPLADAYDSRHDPDAILGMTGVRNIEPLVDKWHAAKSETTKGAASADNYRRQVRDLIPSGKPFPVARFTAAEIRRHLRNMVCSDPTRNRNKAAFSSFADYLVDENVIERNVVRDIKGWSEGDGRTGYYELADAQRLAERIDDVQHRACFALAVGAGVEWGAMLELRVRDLDFSGKHPTVFVGGTKTAWRRRQCRIIWPWCAAMVRDYVKRMLPDALVFGDELRTPCNKPMLKAIKRAAKAAKLPRLTLHDQRHTHAVAMLRDGYRPEVVAKQLGHSTPALVWKRYGRYVVDERDYARVGEDKQEVRENVK